ncbi:MAG TPA: hypothetical protein VMP68_06640 [Candidatus Eisenbacteria bacterium]|nr:hypothetical protein [Candidatus Eisenbacteria bacterium]
MIPLEDPSTVKAEYVRFIWPILRGIALVVALWAFIAGLPALLYSGKWGKAWLVFGIASFVLIAMTAKPETLPAIEGERAVGKRHRLPDWTLLSYCAITGLGYNWACVFLWFSRRYAFFSAPVVGATGLILGFYVVIGVIAAWLTGGSWRTGFLVLALAPCALGGAVLRLGLLR